MIYFWIQELQHSLFVREIAIQNEQHLQITELIEIDENKLSACIYSHN